MVRRMPWRSKRTRGDREAALFAGAVVARVDSSERGADAVRRVLARVELERPVRRLALAALGDPGHAQAVAAALHDREVVVGPVDSLSLEGLDAVIAVVSEEAANGAAVGALARVEELLLGVVVVTGPSAPVGERPDGGPNEALAALEELERATGGPAAAPVERTAAPDSSREQELERRLTELTHREAALRKVTAVVERQRAELAREPRTDTAELEAANERADRAEERVRQLEDELERAEKLTTESQAALHEAIARAERAEARVAELENEAAASAGRADEAEERAADLQAELEREQREHEPRIEAPAPLPERSPSPFQRRHTVAALEELVHEGREQGLPEAEEWSFYLPLLKQHAAPDGTLPPQFDSLVENVFGDRVSG